MAISFDLTLSKKAAFVRGFWKGAAGPLMLFSTFDAPAQAQPQQYRPLQRRPIAEQSDWVKVGAALRLATQRAKDSATDEQKK